MPVSVDATFNCRADGEIKTNPWNFTCTLAVPSNAEELVAKYNEDYKTSYRLLPSANYDLGEGISFKAGENEATGGITVKREGMEAVKYLLPVQLREASHESVALHNEICYFKIGMTYTNPVITFSSAADPTVIRTDEGFYLYATQTNSYWIPIYFLKTWLIGNLKEVLSEKQLDLLKMYFLVEVHFGHRKFATSMESMCFISHGQNGGMEVSVIQRLLPQIVRSVIS